MLYFNIYQTLFSLTKSQSGHSLNGQKLGFFISQYNSVTSVQQVDKRIHQSYIEATCSTMWWVILEMEEVKWLHLFPLSPRGGWRVEEVEWGEAREQSRGCFIIQLTVHMVFIGQAVAGSNLCMCVWCFTWIKLTQVHKTQVRKRRRYKLVIKVHSYVGVVAWPTLPTIGL